MRPASSIHSLLAFGFAAFLLASLSVADMVSPQAFDGVVLDPDAPASLLVADIVPGSGAQRAGIRPGDLIRGIDRILINTRDEAARILRDHGGGDRVLYLVERSSGSQDQVEVRLGQRRTAGFAYLWACLLGLSFFFVGLFVLLRQPRLRAARVFFVLCCLFLLVLVCRLRPASYSQMDLIILGTGTFAFLLLPASFLHFFLIFPKPTPLARRWLGDQAQRVPWTLALVYLTPAVVMGASFVNAALENRSPRLISGAPVPSWWLLVLYMLLGLGALAFGARHLDDLRERRGALLVLVGSIFGLLPFLILVVTQPSALLSERRLLWGLLPLALVPLTFAYAIARFQLLDVRIILRKSLLYTALTALVTLLYALSIAFFNSWASGTNLAGNRFFPLLLALVIALLFEPLRRWLQGPVDRFFFSERTGLQQAMVRLGEELSGQTDPEDVVRDLVRELPEILGLRFAALYLLPTEGESANTLVRRAGPEELPPRLPDCEVLLQRLKKRRPWVLDTPRGLRGLDLLSLPCAEEIRELQEAGVSLLSDLSTRRRNLGLIVLSEKRGQLAFENAELELLVGLLNQASIALENSSLVKERTLQAELDRELAIASSIQSSLLPARVSFGKDWRVAAACRPARDVGGDFFAQLPGPEAGGSAVVYADVSGKSVPGALMMMAAHEVLHSLALTHPAPEQLLNLANRRLYRLRQRSFVALGYLAGSPEGGRLRYTLAGQPPLLRRRQDGEVEELQVPSHRLPLGAMEGGGYQLLETPIEPGELILAYSDGVVDTRSPQGEFFGETRLRALLATAPNDPNQVVETILEALEAFSQGSSPYDDLTLVALSRRQEVGPCAPC